MHVRWQHAVVAGGQQLQRVEAAAHVVAGFGCECLQRLRKGDERSHFQNFCTLPQHATLDTHNASVARLIVNGLAATNCAAQVSNVDAHLIANMSLAGTASAVPSGGAMIISSTASRNKHKRISWCTWQCANTKSRPQLE